MLSDCEGFWVWIILGWISTKMRGAARVLEVRLKISLINFNVTSFSFFGGGVPLSLGVIWAWVSYYYLQWVGLISITYSIYFNPVHWPVISSICQSQFYLRHESIKKNVVGEWWLKRNFNVLLGSKLSFGVGPSQTKPRPNLYMYHIPHIIK